MVRKREANKTTESNDVHSLSAAKIAKRSISPIAENGNKAAASTTPAVINNGDLNKGALKCIGILPGIGKYKESSDSEKSTDTDDEYDFSDYDWIGRKIKKSCKDEECQ